MKINKMTVLTILAIVLITVAPASAYFSTQSVETKAERMTEIAENAREKALNSVSLVQADETAMSKIIDAGLDAQFYDNVSLLVEEGTVYESIAYGTWEADTDGQGWIALDDAKQALLDMEYEDSISYSQEALEIFRGVLKSIHVILLEAEVEVGQIIEPQILQEAIERSTEKILELKNLLADTEMLTKLDTAEALLQDAQSALGSDQIDDAKNNLKEANSLISQVCQDLRDIAQEFNPQRITDYCEGAYQYRERFRERFGQARTEGFDVDGFLQGLGYQNEEDFMARFQEMIQNAEGIEDVKNVLQDLEEIGRLMRNLDQSFTQEMGYYRAQYGQTGSAGGFGQEATYGGYGQQSNELGNKGSYGSGQMGSGGNR